jgi:hypothetical protein
MGRELILLNRYTQFFQATFLAGAHCYTSVVAWIFQGGKSHHGQIVIIFVFRFTVESSDLCFLVLVTTWSYLIMYRDWPRHSEITAPGSIGARAFPYFISFGPHHGHSGNR